MEKPLGIKLINEVINQKTSEEEYFRKRADGSGRLISDLGELEYLKQNPSLLRKFLSSLSLEGRFKVLLTKEMSGMPQKSFITKYGIASDTLRALKGQHRTLKTSPDPELRRITKTGQPRLEILATLAMMTRVPICWLKERNLKLIWDVDYFRILSDVHFTIEKFANYLKTTEEKSLLVKPQLIHTRPAFSYLYDVRGIILHIDSKDIYLRCSFFEQGGFIIELFGERDQFNDHFKLKEILNSYGPLKIGYCQTVIDDHRNMMLLAKSRADRFPFPIEFATIKG